MNQGIVVGIDVSKARLDIRAGDEEWTIHNDLDSIAKFATHLKELQPSLIVVEATGGLERGVLT